MGQHRDRPAQDLLLRRILDPVLLVHQLQASNQAT
jgi:hypothetical protein